MTALDRLGKSGRWLRTWCPDDNSPRFRHVVDIGGQAVQFAGTTAEQAAKHAMLAIDGAATRKVSA